MRNNATIFTIIGSLGVIVTSALTAKATAEVCKTYYDWHFYEYTKNGEPPTKKDIVKKYWKKYIPSTVSAIATIGCIAASDGINKNYQTALLSACSFASNGGNIPSRPPDRDLDVFEDCEEEVTFYDISTNCYIQTEVCKVTMEDGMECYVVDSKTAWA